MSATFTQKLRNSILTFGISMVVLSGVARAEQPNIVLVLMDNFGWGELGTYGGGILRGAPTPRIDSLAEEGMKFLNFNVESQCVPSRSSIMTGAMPFDREHPRFPWGLASMA